MSGLDPERLDPQAERLLSLEKRPALYLDSVLCVCCSLFRGLGVAQTASTKRHFEVPRCGNAATVLGVSCWRIRVFNRFNRSARILDPVGRGG